MMRSDDYEDMFKNYEEKMNQHQVKDWEYGAYYGPYGYEPDPDYPHPRRERPNPFKAALDDFIPATMNIYVFDGMRVYKYEHCFPAETLINEVRSASWLSENPIWNERGWEPGWRSPAQFYEILPLRADDLTPCYLPKDNTLLTKPSVTLHSLTSDEKPASFSIYFEKDKAKKGFKTC